MSGKITVFCPECHCRIMMVDRKSKIDKVVMCRRCKKMVVFKVATCETEIKPIPKRTYASGMTFI